MKRKRLLPHITIHIQHTCSHTEFYEFPRPSEESDWQEVDAIRQHLKMTPCRNCEARGKIERDE